MIGFLCRLFMGRGDDRLHATCIHFYALRVYSGEGLAGYMQRIYIFTHILFTKGGGGGNVRLHAIYIHFYAHIVYSGGEWPATCNIYTFLRTHSLLRGAGVRLHATYIHFYAHIVNAYFFVLNVKGNILCLKMLEFSS